MTKGRQNAVSVAFSGASVACSLTWAATGAPWALWGAAGAFAVALGFVLWSYIAGTEE